jgi:XTP/dITP diphosphohydrolase
VLRVTLVTSSPHVAPGLLTAAAWDLLRSVPVCCADSTHPQLGALADAGVRVRPLRSVPAGSRGGGSDDTNSVGGGTAFPPGDAAGLVAELRRHANALGADEVVWLVDPAPIGTSVGTARPDPAELEAVGDVEVRVVTGSVDPPGGALLDAVAVMDRLRSPGGCPWDAEQTHASLAPYLLEEAYEAYQAIEDGDLVGLREELGDVLMQVLFHARIAAEASSPRFSSPTGVSAAAWDLDDVAAELVAKLVRRHPHVFADVTVDGPDAVVRNWDAIKAEEKGRRSVTEGVPLSQPALSLAAKLLRRGTKIGVPAELVHANGSPDPAAAVRRLAASAADGDREGDAERRMGDLLFAVVALAQRSGVDAEVALRTASRRFRDRLAAAEKSIYAAGRDPATADAATWLSAWPA